MKRLFGTDGIRGEAGHFPLDMATMRRVGYSLTTHLRETLQRQNPILITGRDTRESGEWLEQALIEGAFSAGAICRSAGVITTPGVAFLARTLPTDAGVVISASHNPYQDNGVKIFSPSGKKLEDATEKLIERDIFEAQSEIEPPVPSSELIANYSSDQLELRKRYSDFLVGEIAKGLSLAGLTMVIDCANGAASQLAPSLFVRLGAHVVSIDDQPDGRNINQDCGSLHIASLQRRVTAEQADFGVAFDGDADRALFVDGRGQFVDGDGAMWVLANYLNRSENLRNGIVVGTIMSNFGLEVALRNRGLQLMRADVGD